MQVAIGLVTWAIIIKNIYLGTVCSELAVNKSFWLRERMALAPLQRHLPIKGEDYGACRLHPSLLPRHSIPSHPFPSEIIPVDDSHHLHPHHFGRWTLKVIRRLAAYCSDSASDYRSFPAAASLPPPPENLSNPNFRREVCLDHHCSRATARLTSTSPTNAAGRGKVELSPESRPL